ncbi:MULTISPECIES: TetR/AcrR family transcriptional regulator [Dyella]|uniref:TetR/AcrR family transcriptional regulator n=2 Tax=Dyella TaxID=231454 RepID=A0A4R0Z1Y8_9GAMM|nr:MULTISPECIES: TetR/AcrR family transcriptional regulator [Dyella]TBR40126.1 TetR/AcrR family transcriptional regulator [Dyella terrae]TCI12290.1 TetR/AcrR family transcriptional regulator [Dyella soli]
MTSAKTPRRASGKRGAGRPGRDEPDLRARLLDVAINRFAQEGIAATSLRTIAQEAGVTPAMLHYYFGDKQALKQALIQERLLPALAPTRAALAEKLYPADLIATFVGGMSEVVSRNPWLPPLWVREVLCEGGELREILFSEILPNLPRMLAQRFAQAQENGLLNRALDPRLLVVSLVGLTLFPAAGAPIWRRVFEADDLDPQAMARHTLALLSSGIAAPNEESSP